VSDEAQLFESGDAAETPPPRATVFVSDPSAEAEHVAQLLRGAGYHVVDVPLSILAARVVAQTPGVILIDADASGAAETVAKIREAPGGASIDVLFLGHRPVGGAEADEAIAGGASGFFERPVDPSLLVQKIAALTGGPASSVPGGGGHPRSLPSPEAPAPPWTGSPFERRSPVPTSVAPGSAPLSGRAPHSSGPPRESPLSARPSRPSISIQTSLSPELEALLADAELRIGSLMAHEALPPTPEEEIEAVLPAALLAALDEPLEEDEEDPAMDAPPSIPSLRADTGASGAPRVDTRSGRTVTPVPSVVTSPHTLGVAPTMPAPPAAESTGAPEVPPAPPSISAPRDVNPAPPASPLRAAEDLLPGDVPRLLGGAISARATGCFTFESSGGLRRVVLRDGDVVTAASSADGETLLAFLLARGDVRQDQAKELTGKIPPFGRHAGAALVGHGVLHQEELWAILRAHAEWVLGRTLLVERGASRFEVEAPGRLRQEPSVFGGSSGAEVLVEAARRVISPEEALQRLGGGMACVVSGPSALLAECALDPAERGRLELARDVPFDELVSASAGPDLAAVLYALSLLGVIGVGAAPLGEASFGDEEAPEDAIAALDVAAVRERVRARMDLVVEGDYFTLLGVGRDATGYEVRRAYLELRRGFEPSRILTPAIADLEGDVRTITLVLDEAYEILRDGARRERYRRALGDAG